MTKSFYHMENVVIPEYTEDAEFFPNASRHMKQYDQNLSFFLHNDSHLCAKTTQRRCPECLKKNKKHLMLTIPHNLGWFHCDFCGYEDYQDLKELL